jgi:probable HAF family extracellular repeat protein
MKTRAVSGAIGLLTLAGSAIAQPSFQTMGDLPGGNFYSIAQGISADGRVVVGYSLSGASQGEAVTWINGVLTSIGDLPGGTIGGNAIAVNADGSIIGGLGNGVNGNEACRWTNSANPTGLGGTFAGGLYGSQVNGSNLTGSTLVGSYASGLNTGAACRWDDGVLTPLPFTGPDAVTFDYATAISADNSTIIGACQTAAGDYVACQLRNGTFSILADIATGLNDGEANGVNADGTVVVGRGNARISNVNRTIAVRWVNGTGQDLGDLPGGLVLASALAVSADGNTVVGYSSATSGLEAFIWTPATGMRSLKTVLTTEYGLGAQVGTFVLQRATAISADGLVIAGYGKRSSTDTATEGFIVNLRTQAPCFADFNQDGGIDGADIESFFLAWEAGSTAADVNLDGGVDGSDIETFFLSWEAGGC